MLDLTLLILGLGGLWAGTRLTLDGVVRLCDRYGLSHGFAGLTILAIGTDLPELLVAVSASIQQLQGTEASGVIVGNATGSAIAQGSFVLGVAGLLAYVRVAPRMVRRDGVTLLLTIGLITVLSLDGSINRLEGAVLLITYLIYLVALVQAEHIGREEPSDVEAGGFPVPLAMAFGIAIVTLSAHAVVTSGLSLAVSWGVSQTLVGVLVLGMGTSLPELVLSVGAALRGQGSLSAGNVIGSNVFDLFVPVGVGALLDPLIVERETLQYDLPALALGTVLLLTFLLRRRGLQRGEAAALLVLYVGYATARVVIG
jgi:cation:H+ antiporter